MAVGAVGTALLMLVGGGYWYWNMGQEVSKDKAQAALSEGAPSSEGSAKATEAAATSAAPTDSKPVVDLAPKANKEAHAEEAAATAGQPAS